MKRSLKPYWLRVILCALLTACVSTCWADDAIPKAAWKRPLGLPLDHPGVTRVRGDIDDGYWQGVPVSLVVFSAYQRYGERITGFARAIRKDGGNCSSIT